MTQTRVVKLRQELAMEAAQNGRTALGAFLQRAEPLDGRALFLSRYAHIRKAAEKHNRQGLLIMAFDEQPAPLSTLWLEASLDRSRAAIIGRHGLADMRLPDLHLSVSLRHLVVLVRALDLEHVRVRVIDLNTGVGFSDEQQRSLEAVSADGCTFLRLATVDLLMLPTPELGGWPESAEAAYASLPARVFHDEREATGAPYMRRPTPLPRGTDTTNVRSRRGPMFAAAALCGVAEAPAGAIVLSANGRKREWSVGPEALSRGVLLGRYERCQLGVDDAADPSAISRVHLLVIGDGSEVLAIDTASSNGSSQDGQERRFFTLGSGAVISIADELNLEWVSSGP